MVVLFERYVGASVGACDGQLQAVYRGRVWVMCAWHEVAYPHERK